MASPQLIHQVEELLFTRMADSDLIMRAQDAGVLAVAEGYADLGNRLVAARYPVDVRDALLFLWDLTRDAAQASQDLGWRKQVARRSRGAVLPLVKRPRTATHVTVIHVGYDIASGPVAEWSLDLSRRGEAGAATWLFDWYIATPRRPGLRLGLTPLPIVPFEGPEEGYESRLLTERVYYRETQAIGLAITVLEASQHFTTFMSAVHELIARTAEFAA